MGVSYNKLFKLLIDKQMKKTELIKLADICFSTLSKLSKNELVSMDVILRLCQTLKCYIGDIIEKTEGE